jgi:hypothetical protein
VTRPGIHLAALVAVLGLVARTAGAAPNVELGGCPGLDDDAIARHLADELRAMSVGLDRLEAPPIHIDCTQGSLRVEVRDPLTGKTLMRTVPAPRTDDPAADRMVALAVSELFLSSWLELLLPADERAPPPAPRASSAVPVSSVERVARKAVARSAVRVAASLLGGAGVRDMHAAYPTLRVGLRAGPAFERVALFLGVGFETGHAQRRLGDVSTQGITLGLGGRWRPLGSERAALDVVASGSFVYAVAHGSAAASTDLASSTSGTAAEFAVGLAPALAVGRTELFIEPLVGVTAPGLAARVSGEAPVRWSGFWFAGSIGLRFGGRP